MLNRTEAPEIKDAVEFTLNLKSYQKHILDNGVEVFAVNAGTQDVLQVELVFKAGNCFEKQKAIVTKDDEIVVLKNKIKNAYQLKYDNGMCSMNDVITAVYKESDARSNHALHGVQLLLTQYKFKTITGN